MPIDFKKFQEQFPADEMKKQTEEAKKNEPQKIPDGEYRCKVEKMELKESKKGAPMCAIMFRILAGNLKKQCIFYNRVLAGTKNDGFMMKSNNDFLESLDSGVDVSFESWEQYNDMILDIAEAIDTDKLEYMVSVTTDDSGKYQTLEIVDIIEA